MLSRFLYMSACHKLESSKEEASTEELDWVAFANLIQVRVILEEGIPAEKPFPSDGPIGKSAGHFLDY